MRTLGIVCLLIVGLAGVPYLVGGIEGHRGDVPNTLLVVLAIGGAALLLDLTRSKHT